MVIGHQFEFVRQQDMPILILGLGLAVGMATALRRLFRHGGD
jgi:hypothetical protein